MSTRTRACVCVQGSVLVLLYIYKQANPPCLLSFVTCFTMNSASDVDGYSDSDEGSFSDPGTIYHGSDSGTHSSASERTKEAERKPCRTKKRRVSSDTSRSESSTDAEDEKEKESAKRKTKTKRARPKPTSKPKRQKTDDDGGKTRRKTRSKAVTESESESSAQSDSDVDDRSDALSLHHTTSGSETEEPEPKPKRATPPEPSQPKPKRETPPEPSQPKPKRETTSTPIKKRAKKTVKQKARVRPACKQPASRQREGDRRVVVKKGRSDTANPSPQKKTTTVPNAAASTDKDKAKDKAVRSAGSTLCVTFGDELSLVGSDASFGPPSLRRDAPSTSTRRVSPKRQPPEENERPYCNPPPPTPAPPSRPENDVPVPAARSPTRRESTAHGEASKEKGQEQRGPVELRDLSITYMLAMGLDTLGLSIKELYKKGQDAHNRKHPDRPSRQRQRTASTRRLSPGRDQEREWSRERGGRRDSRERGRRDSRERGQRDGRDSDRDGPRRRSDRERMYSQDSRSRKGSSRRRKGGRKADPVPDPYSYHSQAAQQYPYYPHVQYATPPSAIQYYAPAK